jgi:hypothetical protein
MKKPPRQAPEWIHVAHEAADPQAGFGRAGRGATEADEGFVRQGATRPRVTVARSFGPGLTVRQKTASGRRYRARTAKAWGKMRQTMRDLNITMEEFVESLTNEELARGQIRDKNGNFGGRPPAWIPRDFHRACLKELMRRGATLWRENYVAAIQVMTEIATGKGAGRHATPGERLRAAQYVVERLEGKIPERVEIQIDAPWEAAIADIVANVSDEQIGEARRVLAGAPIVEGEVVTEDDAPEPEPMRRRAREGRRRR